MVMVNVKCHAGTCSISYNFATDYCAVSSVAYTALSISEEKRRWTLIHEAGGHGFGKLSDEYGDNFINSFSTIEWDYLIRQHNSGIYRNINEHWTADEKKDGWDNDFRDLTPRPPHGRMQPLQQSLKINY